MRADDKKCQYIRFWLRRTDCPCPAWYHQMVCHYWSDFLVHWMLPLWASLTWCASVPRHIYSPQAWSGNLPARIQPIYRQSITFYPKWVTRLWHGQHLKNQEHFIHVEGLYIKHCPGVVQVLSTIVSWPLFVTSGAKSFHVIQVSENP